MTVVSELERILELEKRLLLSGDYSALEALSEEKSKLAQRLATAPPNFPQDRYEHLAAQAAHNDALLKSASRGIQAAIAQVHQCASGENQSTYSREGHRRPLSRTPSVTQKY